MALSTELTNHLYTEDGTPFEKRLKLAENAFTSPDFIVTRKEDIILNWLCKTIEENSDNSVPWRILNDCINYQNLHSHSMNLKAPIKSTLIKTLSHGLDDQKNQHNAEFILQCCRSILIDSSEMQKSFISNPDLFIDILSKLLTQKISPNQEDNLQHPQQLSIIIEAVEKLIKYQRQSQDKEKIQDIFINNLLTCLSTFGQKNQNHQQLQSTIIKSIEKIVFGKFDSQFETAEKLFEKLSSKINKVQNEETAVAMSVYIFQASINLNKLSTSSSSSCIDFVYRNLLKLSKNISLKIKICSKLNECLINTSLNMKNEIEGVTFLDYQSSIISEILSANIFEASSYTCLSSFAKLNPLVIETKLSDVFKRILLEKKLTNEDKNSYESLMVDIFDACVRLRRDKKLVSSILMSLDESLAEGKMNENNEEILPDEFINKFTLSVRSMTSSQVTSVLMSFNHHLGLLLFASDRDIITLKVTRQLFIAFIEGVQIADSSWLQPVQQKFVNNLVDLGKTMSNLSHKIHEKSSEFKENVSVFILSMAEAWITIIGFFKHYAPESVTEDIVHNVMEIMKTINKLIKTDGTKKLEFFCKFQENRLRDKSNLFYKLMKKDNVFDDFGGYLVKEYPYGINHLDKFQIFNLAVYLLKDLRLTVELISTEVVRNNRDLVAALILEAFKGIYSRLGDDSESTTKKLMSKIDGLDCWEDGTIKKQVKHQKKQLVDPSWMMIKKKKILSGIEEYLRVLLSLPLMHCSDQLKIFTFLLAFSLKNECPIDSEPRNLCIKILLDLTEAFTFDVLQFIPLNIFLQDLSKNFELIITRSLINSSNYEAIGNLIEENSLEIEKSAVLLVECLEKSKSKLKPDDKQIVQKIEKKLRKIMINNLDNGINNAEELKRLTFVIKLTVTHEKKIEDDSLLKIIQSALDSLIGENKVKDLEATKEGQQFLKVVIQSKARGITLDDKSIKNIWTSMMKQSCEDIVPSLIEQTDAKILGFVLNLLQKKIMISLKEVNKDNETLFENYLSIWYMIVKSEMGANRATTRRSSLHAFLQALISTQIPYVNSYKNILKLCTMITSSIRMHINEKTVDLILQLVNNIITESMSINNCLEVLQLCSGFLKYRMSMIADRLPCLLLLFKKSIKFTIDESRSNTINQHEITLLTLEINKISSALIKMKKDIARLSPYLIADFVSYYADGVIPFYVKESIDESVGLFFSICDQHAISLLNRVLPVSMQEIFKSLYDNYTKFNKFTGKI